MTRIEVLEERILDRTASEAEQLEYDELNGAIQQLHREAFGAEVKFAKPAQTVAEWKASGPAHTPGPWVFSVKPESGPKFCSQTGQPINPGAHFRVDGVDHAYVHSSYSRAENREETEANARLIAAAPDLLEALEDIANKLDDGDTENQKLAYIRRRLSFPLSKARGQHG